MKLIGIDTGGTFTDFVLFDQGRLQIHKVLSTPHAPEEAILQGIADLGLDPAELKVVHGSTVATNAALEGKGVRTVYIANQGLADLLTIGRQARQELYNLHPKPQPPPVPQALCLETNGRLAADGSVITPLTAQDLDDLHKALTALRPEAVAVNLLFSYLDDRFEQAIKAIIPDGLFCSLSSEVLPEIKEYERGIATWLNAWVGPLVEGYLKRLSKELPGAQLSVMQSSGEAIAADQAATQAVRMLLSGPAGGLVGARFVGQASGCDKLLSFDMGGTSTDVALINGTPRLTNEGHIGRYPVAVPMVDMHTIGAGGGSIASIDAGGMLQVGPESAGATPGPACYGLGGTLPTVTDANLILGRLRADAFLGGHMQLDISAAHDAIAPLAAQMNVSHEEAAEGIIQVANEHMSRALRVISVQRGVDPKEFTLISFGGAGGLHVCALAEALGMRQALVPIHAGVLSALGMLATQPGRQLSRTHSGLLLEMDNNKLEQAFNELAAEGISALVAEGIPIENIEQRYSADLRYRGQSYTLNVVWGSTTEVIEHFENQHEKRYGHRISVPVELVNLRVALHGPATAIQLASPDQNGTGTAFTYGKIHGITDEVPIYARDNLVSGRSISGPALITERVATSWLAPGWQCRQDNAGNLLFSHQGA